VQVAVVGFGVGAAVGFGVEATAGCGTGHGSEWEKQLVTKSWTKASLEIGTGAHVQAAEVGFGVGAAVSRGTGNWTRLGKGEAVGVGLTQRRERQLGSDRNRRSCANRSDWIRSGNHSWLWSGSSKW
jgi:hypothetical protein